VTRFTRGTRRGSSSPSPPPHPRTGDGAAPQHRIIGGDAASGGRLRRRHARPGCRAGAPPGGHLHRRPARPGVMGGAPPAGRKAGTGRRWREDAGEGNAAPMLGFSFNVSIWRNKGRTIVGKKRKILGISVK
jgi:hypothetical protein